MVTGIPLVACDDGVRQCERGSWAAEGTAEDRGRCPIRSLVVCDCGARDGHIAISMEDRAAVPASRCVTADGAVDDVEVAQRADTATNIVGNVAADRAAQNRDSRVEEAIHTTTRPGC